jgi:P27 family predicted phage terminase small subunit
MSITNLKDRLSARDKAPPPDLPIAPKHLRKPTRAWWAKVVKDFECDSHHLRLLTLACEAWDRCEQARKILRKKGLTFDDRFGQPCSRPEVAIERDTRIAFARLVRELNLDAAPAPEAPRRPKLKY